MTDSEDSPNSRERFFSLFQTLFSPEGRQKEPQSIWEIFHLMREVLITHTLTYLLEFFGLRQTTHMVDCADTTVQAAVRAELLGGKKRQL